MSDGKSASKRDDLSITVEHEVRAAFAQPGDVAEQTRAIQNIQALPEAIHAVGRLNGGERVGDIGRRREQPARIQVEE